MKTTQLLWGQNVDPCLFFSFAVLLRCRTHSSWVYNIRAFLFLFYCVDVLLFPLRTDLLWFLSETPDQLYRVQSVSRVPPGPCEVCSLQGELSPWALLPGPPLQTALEFQLTPIAAANPRHAGCAARVINHLWFFPSPDDLARFICFVFA